MTNSESKICQNCYVAFVIDASDFDFYKKIDVPAPTFCPDCRLQRRLAFRNEHNLYKRQCALCSKDIITIYSPDKPFTVYCQPCWWSDKWDPTEYGKEYNFSRPFFEQYRELRDKIPLPALNTLYQTLANSDYANQVGHLKNSYMLFNSDYNENCAYGMEIEKSQDCLDCLAVSFSTLCYECVNCSECYETFFSVDCEGCHNIWLSKNCVGSSNCFGCVNLRKQKYCIFNEQYQEAEYRAEIKKLTASAAAFKEAKKKFAELTAHYPVKFAHERQNANSNGEYIYHCRDVRNSYIASEAQNCKFAMWLVAPGTKDSWDYTEYGDSAELVYESVNVGQNISRVMFTSFSFSSLARVEYSSFCFSSQDLFGCVSLRNQKHCILNRRYSPEEYGKLTEQIRKQMMEIPYRDANGREYRFGEFFPVELSPFGYNETSAGEFFPLSKEKASTEGYKWKDPAERNLKITIEPSSLPETEEAGEEILNGIIGCGHADQSRSAGCAHNCTLGYRIIPQEFAVLKKYNLPLPHLCFNCRYGERMKDRTLPKFRNAVCACAGNSSADGNYRNANLLGHQHSGKCGREFQTTYPENYPSPLYCEACYNSEVT